MEMPESLRLENALVVLRDWRDEDAPALAPVCGEWNVCAFTSVPWSYSASEAQAWIDRQRQKRAAGTVLALAIEERDGGTALGNVNLVRFSDDDGEHKAAIGYWLVPDARGRGLATAATSLLSDWGLPNLGLERVEFAILPENLASQRVAQRVGATSEGIREHSHEAEGRWWDMTIWSVTQPRC
jgi:RimJ/RimL family protein N-acetyltransferase